MSNGWVIGIDRSRDDDGVMPKASVPSIHDEYTQRWVELRDAQGKLQGKWDPVACVLEIQARGITTWYWLG